jgi:hypothetical protein
MLQTAAYDSFKNTNTLNVAISQVNAGLSDGAEQQNYRNTQFSFLVQVNLVQ